MKQVTFQQGTKSNYSGTVTDEEPAFVTVDIKTHRIPKVTEVKLWWSWRHLVNLLTECECEVD